MTWKGYRGYRLKKWNQESQLTQRLPLECHDRRRSAAFQMGLDEGQRLCLGPTHVERDLRPCPSRAPRDAASASPSRSRRQLVTLRSGPELIRQQKCGNVTGMCLERLSSEYTSHHLL